jgi:hypothetical protein
LLAGVSEERIISSLYRTQTPATNLERLTGILFEAVPRTGLFDDLYEAAVIIYEEACMKLPSKSYFINHWYGYQCIGAVDNKKGPEKQQHNKSIFSPIMPTTKTRRNPSSKQGKTIQQLQQKLQRVEQQNKQIKQQSSKLQAMARSTNSPAHEECHEFVMSMLDPEHYGPIRYPDEFSEPTSIYKAINNINMPIVVNDDPTNYTFQSIESGSYWAEITPSFDDTITYLTYEKARLTETYFSLSQQSNLYGFKPIAGDQAFYPPASNMSLNPDTYAHLSIPLSTADGVLQRNRRTDGGYEMLNVFGASMSVHWFASGVALDTSTISIETWKSIDGAAAILSDVQTFNVGAGASGNYTWSSAPFQDSFRPGYGISLRVKNTLLANNGCQVSFNCVGRFPLTGFAFEAERLTDISTLQQDVEKYRFVAQSALVTYLGNVLTMAGQCSSLLYRGGVPAQFNQVWDLETLAVHKQAYSGKTVEGTYSYWEPQDTGDMVFESVFSDNIFKRPYILCAGLVNQNSDDVLSYENLIRLRVVSHIEFTTKSQINESQPSDIHPEMIVCRALVLKNIPNSMENGKHLQKLKQFGNKVFGATKKMANFLWTHRDAIIQAGETLAPLMMV